MPIVAAPITSNRPIVYQRKGESFISAADRYRRETGHSGWCIIVMRQNKYASAA